MDQSDQNTPAQQDPVTDDSAEVVATPGLGLAKGIIAISLGVVLLVMIFSLVLTTEAFFLALLSPIGSSASLSSELTLLMLLAPTVSGLIPFGLCLWRGILAIRYRKVRRVTPLNFGLWLGFFILIVLPIIGFALVGLILLVSPWSGSFS